jgi:hypothetical protein
VGNVAMGHYLVLVDAVLPDVEWIARCIENLFLT